MLKGWRQFVPNICLKIFLGAGEQFNMPTSKNMSVLRFVHVIHSTGITMLHTDNCQLGSMLRLAREKKKRKAVATFSQFKLTVEKSLIFPSGGWVKAYYDHNLQSILGNKHPLASYFRVLGVPGFWLIAIDLDKAQRPHCDLSVMLRNGYVELVNFGEFIEIGGVTDDLHWRSKMIFLSTVQVRL